MTASNATAAWHPEKDGVHAICISIIMANAVDK
jgi:hypothetical protein